MKTRISAYLLHLILFGLFPAAAFAQTQGAGTAAGQPQAFSLRQAVQYGLANSPMVRNAQSDVDIAKARVGETRAIGLPQIAGQVQYTRTFQPQRFVLEISKDNPFTSTFITPQTTFLEGYPFGIGFAPQHALAATGTVTQLIFNGSYIVGLQASNTYKELSNKQLTQARINLEGNITRAYYQALVGQEQIGLLDINIARLDSSMREVQALFKNGFAERIDVDRLEVARNNLISQKNSAVRGVELAIAALKFQMNFPSDQPLRLTESLQNAVVDAAVPAAAKDYDQRIDYSILSTQESLALLDLKNKRAGYLPSLAAFGNFGANSGASKFASFWDRKNYELRAPDGTVTDLQRWYPMAFVGANLNIPIFDGGQKHFQTQQAKFNIQKLRNAKELVRNQIDLENQSALVSLRNALEKLEIERRNLTLATEVARVTRIKQKNGIGSNLEVVTAESDLRQAQTNYYTTIYDVLVAKLDLELAGGRISGN